MAARAILALSLELRHSQLRVIQRLKPSPLRKSYHKVPTNVHQDVDPQVLTWDSQVFLQS